MSALSTPCRAVLMILLAGSTACPKDAAPAAGAVDAGSADAVAVPPAVPPERVVFTNATGWSGGRACTDVQPVDGCDSQWLHTTGQVVRVFVVPVKNPAALAAFVDKLAADVTAQGGIVDRFSQAGLTLVRFLQPVTDGSAELVSINYALVGRDQRAVHLITSVVALAQQQTADERLRALLGFAAWTSDRATVAR